MKREIKYKAFDRHNKVWVGPYSLKQLAYDDQFNYDKEVMPICSKFEDFDWVEFTGLKDKNGKEIYEGDMIERGNGEIFYSDKFGGFRIMWHDSTYRRIRGVDEPLFLNSEIVWEVVGNIYETPELITNKTLQP